MRYTHSVQPSFYFRYRNPAVTLAKWQLLGTFSAQLKQVLPSSIVTAATTTNLTAVHSLPFTFHAPKVSLQPILSSSTHQFSDCSIVSLVLASIAFQKWGSFSSSFLASSIGIFPIHRHYDRPFPRRRSVLRGVADMGSISHCEFV